MTQNAQRSCIFLPGKVGPVRVTFAVVLARTVSSLRATSALFTHYYSLWFQRQTQRLAFESSRHWLRILPSSALHFKAFFFFVIITFKFNNDILKINWCSVFSKSHLRCAKSKQLITAALWQYKRRTTHAFLIDPSFNGSTKSMAMKLLIKR